MTNIIVENEEKPGVGVVMVQAPPPPGFETRSPMNYITNAQIRNVMSDGQPYHFVNKMIIKLRPSPSQSTQPVFHEAMSVQGSWGATVYFRDRRTSDTGLERDTFSPGVVTVLNNITITGGGSNAELVFNSRLESAIDRIFDRDGVTRPEHGMMILTFRALFRDDPSSENEFKYLFKVTFEPMTTTVSPAGIGAPVPLAESSITSKPLAFESLHVPTLTASFKYNFFEVDEDSLLSARRKSYRLHRLTSIPRYVELQWSPAPTVSLLRTSVTGAIGRLSEDSVVDGGARATRRTLSEDRSFETGGRAPFVDSTFESAGGDRRSSERSVEFGTVGMIGGEIFSLGGVDEETAGIFGSRTSTGLLSREGLGRRFSPSRRPGYVGEDSTVSLGLPEQEDLILRELVRNSDEPDTIAGPNEWSRYIGYVVLKERFDSDSAQFEPVDMIAVLDRRKNRIIDTKIAYGDTYRYKVRSVFKFVNVDNLPLFRDQDTVFSASISGSIRAVFDGGVPFRNAFYFDSKFSNPAEILTVEITRPDAPGNIRLFPNSEKEEIFITWNQKQQERDVSGFNVYRKLDVAGSVWSRLNDELLPLRRNFFTDRLLKPDVSYIYAVETMDHHDNFSKLSIQPKANLRRQDFSLGRLESPVQIHLNEETEFEDTAEPESSDVIKFKNKLKIVINPLFGNLDREATYLLLIKSLDTFEQKEVKLNFVTKIINHSGSVTVSDDTFEERRDRITEGFRDAEQERFGLTANEARRRRNTSGREGFEE